MDKMQTIDALDTPTTHGREPRVRKSRAKATASAAPLPGPDKPAGEQNGQAMTKEAKPRTPRKPATPRAKKKTPAVPLQTTDAIVVVKTPAATPARAKTKGAAMPDMAKDGVEAGVTEPKRRKSSDKTVAGKANKAADKKADGKKAGKSAVKSKKGATEDLKTSNDLKKTKKRQPDDVGKAAKTKVGKGQPSPVIAEALVPFEAKNSEKNMSANKIS